MSLIVTRSEFKNKPILVLSTGEEDKYPFSFGLSKAKKIVEAYEEIKKFVEEEEAKKAE
jgi:hypothetical protein